MKLKINSEFLRYGIVGVTSVIIDYFVIYISYSLLENSMKLAVTLGYFISTVVNYFLHKNYTFSSTKENHKNTIFKYIILIIGSYLLTISMISFLCEDLNMNLYMAKAGTLILVYIYGFIIGKYFIFK